jgi:hypothetical protein
MKNVEMMENLFKNSESYLTKVIGMGMNGSGSGSIFDIPQEAMPYLSETLGYWQNLKVSMLQYAAKMDNEKEDAERRHKEEIQELKDELREQRRLLNDILQRVSMPD